MTRNERAKIESLVAETRLGTVDTELRVRDRAAQERAIHLARFFTNIKAML